MNEFMYIINLTFNYKTLSYSVLRLGLILIGLEMHLSQPQ